METIEIVNLKSEEWQLYRDLRLRALTEDPQAFASKYEDNAKHPDEYWKQRLGDAHTKERQWLLFAKVGDKIVGQVGAMAERDIDDAHIIGVYVIPEARGKGISKLLMKDLVSRIKKITEIKKITVDVNPEQQSALNLYKNSGFEIIKKYRMVLGDGKEHDVYQLQMSISEE